MKKIWHQILLTCIFLTITHAMPTSRIVGGKEAQKGQFPYQVSVRIYGYHICGGSIISHTFVLTAAHCVVTEENVVQNASDFSIRAGSIDRLSGGVLRDVQQIIVHDHHESNTNDIALLKLKTALSDSKYIKPIPLASSANPVGVEVLASGWGNLATGGQLSETLQWVTLRTLSQSECAQVIGHSTDALICLAHDVGKGVCNADSGGPAAYNGQLVGVIDFVLESCGGSKPDGVVSVYFHRDWIREHAEL